MSSEAKIRSLMDIFDFFDLDFKNNLSIKRHIKDDYNIKKKRHFDKYLNKDSNKTTFHNKVIKQMSPKRIKRNNKKS